MSQNTVIDTGSMKYTFTDKDGDVFAYFKLNPTDPRLLKKCKSMMDFFMTADESTKSPSQWEETVEKKFSEFLGYDCSKSLFGRIAATDVMKDGRIFASHVLDAMIAHIGPEIQKRRKERVEKYTARYAK